MTQTTKDLTWKWYKYGRDENYDCWRVTNLITKKSVLTSTEEACMKIIELAYSLKKGHPKPLNHKTLERKAKHIEGIHFTRDKRWNGKGLAYDTFDYEPD